MRILNVPSTLQSTPSAGQFHIFAGRIHDACMKEKTNCLICWLAIQSRSIIASPFFQGSTQQVGITTSEIHYRTRILGGGNP